MDEMPMEDQTTLLRIKEFINKYYKKLEGFDRQNADEYYKLCRKYCSWGESK